MADLIKSNLQSFIININIKLSNLNFMNVHRMMNKDDKMNNFASKLNLNHKYPYQTNCPLCLKLYLKIER